MPDPAQTPPEITAIHDAFAAALRAADPAAAVARAWPDGLGSVAGARLFAFGKGSVAMAGAALDRLTEVAGGLVIAVPEHVGRVSAPGIEVMPADHPFPTQRNVEAARRLAEFASRMSETDTALVLISGGGSAQVCMPGEGVTLDDLTAMTHALLRAGATINELNTVRKHAEVLKGGGLARLLHPARVVVLVLSDVLGDPLDVISSGPTSPDPTSYRDALGVVDRYDLRRIAPSITSRFMRGVRGEEAETPKEGDALFARVTHSIIANNEAAIHATAAALEQAGYTVVERRLGVQGEAAEVGRSLAARAVIARSDAPRAIVWGGETTVTVGDATGSGGRNQELALAAAMALDSAGADAEGIAIGSLATDGRDGPTDAAGGVITGASVARARRAGVSAGQALASHDSLAFLRACEGLLRTGATGTNVNDVMVATVGARE